MSNDLKIKVDFKQLNKFMKLSRKTAIGAAKRSIRATVNDQSWTTQKIAKFREIPKSMTTRGKFNQTQVRVTTAKSRSLTSIVGATTSKGYRGLKNLELGKTEKNSAIPHLKQMRGGNKRKKIPKSKRMSSRPMKLINSKKSLASTGNSGYKGLWKITNKFSKLNPGIYQYVGKGTRTQNGLLKRRIEWMYDTQHPQTKATRNKWLYRSTKKGSTPALTKRFWLRNSKRFIKSALDRALKK